MAPLIASIVATLVKENMPKVAQAVVDKGIDYVQDKLGLEIKPDENNELSPELIVSIKQAAMKHEEFRIEQDNKNTADARDMQKVALNQTDTFSKRFVYWFIAGWSIAAASYIGFVTFGYVPPDNMRIVDTMIGFVQGTIVATMFNYLLGSSSGSMRKTDMLAKDK